MNTLARQNNCSNLFLDLDGTIIDTADRYYQVHCRILERLRATPTSQSEFWQGKRRRISIPELLRDTQVDADIYRREWRSHIEDYDYLKSDRLIPGITETLERMLEHFPLHLITLRRDSQALGKQLDKLGLPKYFSTILVGHVPRQDGWVTKASLICERGIDQSGTMIAGDTEVDIRAGRLLGFRTVAVCSGIRSQEILASESPDAILADLTHLPDYIGT